MQMWVATIHRIHIGSAPDYAACTRYPPDAQQATTVRATSQRRRHSGPVLRAPSFGWGGRACFTVKVVLQAAFWDGSECSNGWIPVTAWCHVAAYPNACCGSEQQAARDQQVAVDRALHRDNHWPLIQAPTLPITAMTATSRRPRSTVYSTKEAPSSSLPRRRTRVREFDMRHSSQP